MPGGNPFPITTGQKFLLASAYVSHQLDAKPTYLDQWNLSVQRQFGTNWLVTGNYVGNNTVHLWTGNAANPAIFLGLGACTINAVAYPVCSTTANTNQRRLLYLQNPSQGQYFAGVTYQDTGGTANYNALFLSVQRRLNRGVTIQANYTWSHCISDVQNTELGTAGPVYTIPFNRKADHSNCALSDLRQNANVSVVAQTPKFSSALATKVASDWQVSFIINARSGLPLTVATGVDNALDGQATTTERPNQVLANPYLPNPSSTGWLNPAAFATPASGTNGNLGAVNLLGPGALQFDMALVRAFRIRERHTLQVRAEAFNVLNTVNFSAPVATLNAPNFGQITSDISGSQAGGLVASSGDPRILQLALKYLF